MSRIQEAFGVLRGLQAVAEASIKLQEDALKQIWDHSSVRTLAKQVTTDLNKKPTTPPTKQASSRTSGTNPIIDGAERLNTVVVGIREFANLAASNFAVKAESNPTAPSTIVVNSNVEPVKLSNKVDNFGKTVSSINYKIKLTEKDKQLLKKLDLEQQAKSVNVTKIMEAPKKQEKDDLQPELVCNVAGLSLENTSENVSARPSTKQNPKVTAVPNPKSKLKLSAAAKQRAVPSSRISRMVSFGTLAAGLGLGTVAEYTKRAVGLGESSDSDNLFLTQANMDRIVDTLCKVRGAALKLGQIMSIQDESLMNPELARALERVRKSADFMPTWQVEKVMQNQLGADWRSKIQEFDEKPFAAASIGQVHWGKTLSGEEVAIKIQYPGVAKGIESDIENLLGIMKVWNIFPKGMFVDNLADVAKKELAWEVDYIREAECTRKFKDLLTSYPDFFVPKVINELSASEVFTTQLVDGIPVDQCVDLDQEERDFIGEKILELCLLELMEFKYMQTDPNWANFLYNRLTKQIVLLDFGASREYSKQFMDKYMRIIKSAAQGDRKGVLQYSQDIGFLTGYENKAMEDAHVEAVMILGEVFRTPGKFDFGVQNTTSRIQDLVPTMIANRLCPPPEEIYSIHRKISGIFLLCLKLKSSIRSKDIFERIFSNYNFLY